MNGRALFAAALWAAGLGLLVSVLRGQDRVVSIELWLAGFVTFLAATVLWQVVKTLPVVSGERRAQFRNPFRKQPEQRRTELLDLRTAHSLILRASENERVHTNQLRPRLRILAEHYLSVNHGVELQDDSGRVQAIFGDTAWLIGHDTIGRAPTLDEFERFFTLVGATQDGSATETPT